MLFIDAHVHIYDCFDLEKFFDSAYANFKSAAEQLGYGNNFTGILLFSETSKDNWFNHLIDYADGKDLPKGKDTGAWKFHLTNENCSLIARSEDSKGLILIAGHQIITSEGLEILALSTTANFKDGIPIVKLIEEINKKNSLAVIPWGFGKWLGKRGEVVNKVLETTDDPAIFLGDNGGRPAIIPRPSQFRKGERKGIRILPGSDPLPLASESQCVGRFGFLLNITLSDKNPASSLKNMISDSSVEIKEYGNLKGFITFCKSQVILRFKS